VIAHCPACGTHYRHDVLATPMRGRCGRCDTPIDLTRLRSYRLVAPRSAEAMAVPAGVVAVEETQTTSRATLVAAPAAFDATGWENEDPLPPIPEMAVAEIDLRPMPATAEGEETIPSPGADGAEGRTETPAPSASAEGRGTTWLLWVAAGAIAGTGISWTLGGTTLAGVGGGTLAGAIAGWGWLRWMSPR
jgi:hypothetical protein